MLAISFPIFLSILVQHPLLISELSMNQQNRKVNRLEPGKQHINTTEQGSTNDHQPVADVVGVTADAPPRRDDERSTTLGLHCLQVSDAGISGVLSELILLAVGEAEGDISDDVDGGGEEEPEVGERLGVDVEVLALEGVEEGNPCDVAEAEHETESVVDNIHHGDVAGLELEGVDDVEEVAEAGTESRKELTVGIGSEPLREVLRSTGFTEDSLVLGNNEGPGKNRPTNQTRTEFENPLEVEFAQARVQLTTDPEVVENIAGVTTGSCELVVA